MDFAGLVKLTIDSIINPLILLAYAVALAYFLYGVLNYIKNAGDQKARDEGKKMMFYGIVALFVMTSVWGLVAIISNTLNLENAQPPIPRLNR